MKSIDEKSHLESVRYRITSHNGKSFDCRSDQTVLEAALAQQCFIPNACTNGVCEVCYGNLLSGVAELRDGTYIEAPPVVRDVLYCITKPKTDLVIEVKAFRGRGEFKLQTISCQIESVTALNYDVYQVMLRTPAGKQPEYHAGQYLELLPEDGKAYPFTIACAPKDRQIELHIQVHQENEGAKYILQQLQSQKSVRVKLPMGNCFLPIEKHDLKPTVLLIAAGTGFSQMKSIVEALADYNDEERPEIHLYWVGKIAADLYANELAESWQQQGLIKYFPIVRDTEQGWDGYSGLIEDLVVKEVDALSESSAFFCGSPNFVYGILDALLNDGLNQTHCYSDVFDYAPRS